MARIQPIGFTDHYTQARERSSKLSETNDCAVVALAVVTGLEYDVCHAALKKAGRIDGRGTYREHTEAALLALGFRITRFGHSDIQRMIATYPGVHCNLKSITTHHPRRFAHCFAGFKTSLWFSETHVAAFKDNQLHDWSVNRALRIKTIWIVEKAA
jgi:hypothetical protein